MENETSQAVVGDSVAAALEESRGGRKRRFGWRKKPKKEADPLTHCENCGEELRGRRHRSRGGEQSAQQEGAGE